MTIAVRIYPHYRKALLPHSLVCAVMTQMMPLSDDDRNECLRMAQGPYVQAYPIDASKVARAQPSGDGDARGRDPRAPHARLSACPACRRNLTRDDWEHSREIGQCAYPYTEPWIPDCPGCQDRKPRHSPIHTYLPSDGCRWASAPYRASTTR